MDAPSYSAHDAPVPEGTVVIERASTAQDLGPKLNRTAADVVRFLLTNGEMVTATQSLSDEMIELFAEEIPESRGFHVVRCDACGLAATHPAPTFDEIVSFYGDEYYGKENAKFGPLTELFILLFRVARLRALRLARVRRGGAVLDVGCGRGSALRTLLGCGFSVVHGIELSEELFFADLVSLLQHERKSRFETSLPYQFNLRAETRVPRFFIVNALTLLSPLMPTVVRCTPANNWRT